MDMKRSLSRNNAPEFIGKDDYQGRHTVAAGKRFRTTTWEARELAALSREGVIFVSFGHVGGVERFGRTRYVADAAGSLHCYDSDGAKKIVHPAGRTLRILTH